MDTHLHSSSTLKTTESHRKIMLFVLGMHGAGTSAVARVLGLLGADLPSRWKLAEISEGRPGSWESAEVVDLNDRLLAFGKRTWDDVRETPVFDSQIPEVAEFLLEARQLLERDFSKSILAVVEDPRVGRLVPFWCSAAEQLGWEPRFVLSFRDPEGVANSLAIQDGIGRERALQLWLRHIVESEAATRAYKRTFVSNHSLLSDWESTVLRIQEQLDLQWPKEVLEVEGGVAESLTSVPRFNRTTLVGESTSLASRAFHWLREAEVRPESVRPESLEREARRLFESLEGIRPVIDEYQQALFRSRAEASDRSAQSEKLTEDLVEAAEWTDELVASLDSEKAERKLTIDWVIRLLYEAAGGEPPNPRDELSVTIEEGIRRARELREGSTASLERTVKAESAAESHHRVCVEQERRLAELHQRLQTQDHLLEIQSRELRELESRLRESGVEASRHETELPKEPSLRLVAEAAIGAQREA